MPTRTVENYLKALFYLANEQNEVGISELSDHLEVSRPSANSMVKKLHDAGFVTYRKYRPLQLTESGRKEAAKIIRKHRLTEMFLVEKMGFGWEEVHSIAEQIEHIKSPLLFERMDELLEYPTIDPHGSPIPSKDGSIQWVSYETLNNCIVGQTVVLKALTQSSTEFLEFLNSRQLSLETELTILKKESFDESISVQVDDQKMMLTKQVAERLLVQEVE